MLVITWSSAVIMPVKNELITCQINELSRKAYEASGLVFSLPDVSNGDSGLSPVSVSDCAPGLESFSLDTAIPTIFVAVLW